MMDVAMDITEDADMLIVVGTSLAVYPAAGLVYAVRPGVPVYVVDPNTPDIRNRKNVTFITEPASTGLPGLVERLLKEAA